MQRALLILMLAVGLLGSVAVNAQPAPSRGLASEVRSEQFTVTHTAKVLAIATGIIVSAIVVDTILPDDVLYFVGGAVGAYAAVYWYRSRPTEAYVNAPR
jgi:hypothetical protein